MKKIRAVEVSKHFGKLKALSNVDIEVKSGDCIGIVGPNGSGKTTLLKILSGLMSASDGVVSLQRSELELLEIQQAKRHIGIVPQEECLDLTLSVVENLIYFARYSGVSKKVATDRANDFLNTTPVKARKTDEITGLSTGTKKKIAILRCMMTAPDFIFMDEPANHLDVSSKEWLYNLIKSQSDKGIIISSHDIHDIDYLCNYTIILKEGKVIAKGTPKDLISKHIERFALEFRLNSELERLPEFVTLKSSHNHFFKDDSCIIFSNNRDELKKFSDTIVSSSITIRETSFNDLYISLMKQ